MTQNLAFIQKFTGPPPYLTRAPLFSDIIANKQQHFSHVDHQQYCTLMSLLVIHCRKNMTLRFSYFPHKKNLKNQNIFRLYILIHKLSLHFFSIFNRLDQPKSKHCDLPAGELIICPQDKNCSLQPTCHAMYKFHGIIYLADYQL